MWGCDPDDGGRWPSSQLCGGHGSCVLDPAWNGNMSEALRTRNHNDNSIPLYSCQCDSGWTSAGDFMYGPQEYCHIHPRTLLAMWCFACFVISLVTGIWFRVMKSYVQLTKETDRKKHGSGGEDPATTVAHESQLQRVQSSKRGTRQSHHHARSRFGFLQPDVMVAQIQWIWTNPTRRTLAAIFFIQVLYLILCVIKICSIAVHLADGEDNQLIGYHGAPTFFYASAAVSFLIMSHFSSLIWCASAQVFYSRNEGEKLMKQTIRVILILSVVDWIAYLLPVAAAILANSTTSYDPRSYYDPYEILIALHFQFKGLVPMASLIADLSMAWRLLQNVRKHAVLQEKLAQGKQNTLAEGGAYGERRSSFRSQASEVSVSRSGQQQQSLRYAAPPAKPNAARASSGAKMIHLAAQGTSAVSNVNNSLGTGAPVLNSMPARSAPATRVPSRRVSISVSSHTSQPTDAPSPRGTPEMVMVGGLAPSRKGSISQAPVAETSNGAPTVLPPSNPAFLSSTSAPVMLSNNVQSTEADAPIHLRASPPLPGVVVPTVEAENGSIAHPSSVMLRSSTLNPQRAASPDRLSESSNGSSSHHASPYLSASEATSHQQQQTSVLPSMEEVRRTSSDTLKLQQTENASSTMSTGGVSIHVSSAVRMSTSDTVSSVVQAVPIASAAPGAPTVRQPLRPNPRRSTFAHGTSGSFTASLQGHMLSSGSFHNTAGGAGPVLGRRATGGGLSRVNSDVNLSPTSSDVPMAFPAPTPTATHQTAANTGSIQKTQAEIRASNHAQLTEFTQRLQKHNRTTSVIATVWLIVNTLFAWIPLLRSYVPYVIPLQVLATAIAVRTLLYALSPKRQVANSASMTEKVAPATHPQTIDTNQKSHAVEDSRGLDMTSALEQHVPIDAPRLAGASGRNAMRVSTELANKRSSAQRVAHGIAVINSRRATLAVHIPIPTIPVETPAADLIDPGTPSLVVQNVEESPI